MQPDSVIVPAPADIEGKQFVHSVSGALVTAKPVAFRVRGDVAEPIWYPALDQSWGEVVRLPSGYLTAHGRQALYIHSLCSAIKDGRASNV